jgi:hypothetical protein
MVFRGVSVSYAILSILHHLRNDATLKAEQPCSRGTVIRLTKKIELKGLSPDQIDCCGRALSF